jgi:pyruvate-ferredoxin/flavodoxin oxidoreductase
MKINNSINIPTVTIDGNEAAAYVAFRTNEICSIYPITPATQMGEFVADWAAAGKKNIWGHVPAVAQMQSEAGVAGAMHGALQTGSLATTFTSSQGLLLMIPNMYHMAAELLPGVIHVASRTVAYHGMSIYCDHSDVMATRQTGFAIFCAANVQEAHDFALIAEEASLLSRIPFVHFFDGFRTSHELAKIKLLSDDEIRSFISEEAVIRHRNRRLTPENPTARGVITDSDIFFQTREALNLYYQKFPEIFSQVLERFGQLTGRKHQAISYHGDPSATRVIVLMGSGANTVLETVSYLSNQNEKVGFLKVSLFHPFPKEEFLSKIPKTCTSMAVLDRTKELGASGEPLYQEVAGAIVSCNIESVKKIKIIGGRYGLGGKEFNPAMIIAIYDELKKESPRTYFTVGIEDDLTHLSLSYQKDFYLEKKENLRAIFYGFGADGTVSACKNNLKIVGEETDLFVQGYSLYDARKSGAKTVSHLRFSKEEINSSYLIQSANFIACHQFNFLGRVDVLELAEEGSTFLLNCPYPVDQVWRHLPKSVQQTIINKNIKLYVIDAYRIAEEQKIGAFINVVMQVCFFALTDLLPKEKALAKIKEMIAVTYANKGEKIIARNCHAVDSALNNLFPVTISSIVNGVSDQEFSVCEKAPEFIQTVFKEMYLGRGNGIPVSCFPADGTFPTHTSRFEKRSIAHRLPEWNPELCIQCGQCSVVCPHAAVRVKSFIKSDSLKLPDDFKMAKAKGKAGSDLYFTLQIYAEDCTGCGLCQDVCPVTDAKTKKKAIEMQAKPVGFKPNRHVIKCFENLDAINASENDAETIRDLQHLSPNFEFSFACSGCTSAAYVKLLSQLFGDRLMIANACGCSSVYGGSHPSSPWVVNKEGKGPAYCSSLFEDNAEFGFGYLLSAEQQKEEAFLLLDKMQDEIGKELVTTLKKSTASNNRKEISEQRARIGLLQQKLKSSKNPLANGLLSLLDSLVKKSIWAVGGDGWAYDIGFGGVDHVLESGRDINLLVLDSEVYSNTGGQTSKATPRGAVAKFSNSGKKGKKKDLGMLMINYGHVYVASVSLGANPAQALRAFKEAESYPGSSLILAYCPCFLHGIETGQFLEQQKQAVKSGHWPLYRYNPLLREKGLNPFQLDSAKPTVSFKEYALKENRFQILMRTNPELAEQLFKENQDAINEKWEWYQKLL